MKRKFLIAFKYLIIFYQIVFSITLAKLLYKRPTITKISEFSNEKNIFLFVGFSKKFDWSTINILSEARELGLYIVYVNNCDDFDIKFLDKNLVDVYINNHNIGWDFSLYKTGTLYIQKELSEKQFERVIYANDSVFYLKNGLRQFFEKFINTKIDVIGPFENSGFGKYHISSWFLSIDRKVFLNCAYQKFYRSIFDIKNKFYSIHFGEHRLTNLLLNICDSFEGVYDNRSLLQRAKNKFKGVNFIEIFDSEPLRDYMLRVSAKNLSFNDYMEFLDLNLWLCSPIHVFGVFLILFDDFPILKKDLYWTSYHHHYSSLGSVIDAVAKMDSIQTAESIKFYYLKRGRLRDGSLLQKFQAYAGLRA